MTNFSFTEGQRIQMHQVEYTLDRFFRSERTWQIRNDATGECTKRPLSELHELYRTEQLSFLTLQPSACDASARIGKELLPQTDQYLQSQRARAQRYETYLIAIDRARASGDTRPLRKIIADVAQINGDLKPPAVKTIKAARTRWIACNRDPRSLMMAFDRSGNRDRFSPAMEWLIRISLKGHLSLLRKRITICWHDLNSKVAAINSRSEETVATRFTPDERDSLELKQLRNEAPFTTPEISTLYRRVHSMSGYDIMVAQYGKDYADRVYRTTLPGEKSPRRLARIDGDETTTDIFCVDEVRGLWLGRVYATVLYEDFCHGVIGFYLGFEPHSTLSYFRATRHSILPKTYIAAEYPTIKHTWDLCGVGDLYHFDNAMAAHGKDLEEALKALRASVLFDLPATPWFKGLIERWFRELNAQFLHNQPGTTFSRFADLDGDYNPEKNAVIPYGLLLLMFHKFIVDIHLQSWNREISDTPSHRWANVVDELPPPFPPLASELDIVFGRRIEKQIFPYGIEIDHLKYQSSELGTLRRRLSRPGTLYPLVDVSAPPGDIGHIHVMDPKTKKYIRVPSVNPEYTTGLSRHAHRVHLQWTRKYKDGRVDVDALSEAQATIWSWSLEAIRLNKQIARYMEDHSRQNPVGPLASHDLVTKVLNKLSGKEQPPQTYDVVRESKSNSNKTKRRGAKQPTLFFETDELPDLSASDQEHSKTR